MAVEREEHIEIEVVAAVPEPRTVPVPRARQAASASVTGLFILLFVYFLHAAAAIVLPIAVALLLAMLLSPPLRVLRRLGFPVPLAAGVVVLLFVTVLGGAFFAVSSPAADWLEEMPKHLKTIERKLEAVRGPIEEVSEATKQMEDLARLDPNAAQTRAVEIRQPGFLRLTLLSTPAALVSIAVTFVLLYFILASGREIMSKLASSQRSQWDRHNVIALTRAVESDISRYLVTVTVINLTLGAVTAAMLYLMGLPNAILWGVVVALLNFAPYVGATISAALLTIVALLTFDKLGQALLVPAGFITIAFIEGQLITPSIVGRRLSLSPLLVFLSVIVCGWLWGVVGALIAVPLLASVKIVCAHVPQWSRVATFIGRMSPSRAPSRQPRVYGNKRASPE
jgi:predicted PurR-regulated permease PerM